MQIVGFYFYVFRIGLLFFHICKNTIFYVKLKASYIKHIPFSIKNFKRHPNFSQTRGFRNFFFVFVFFLFRSRATIQKNNVTLQRYALDFCFNRLRQKLGERWVEIMI